MKRYGYEYNMKAWFSKVKPCDEPVNSCIKSRNLVNTATTPTPLAVQLYVYVQVFTCEERLITDLFLIFT